jgi:isoquinoline 1-oxidoreductase beta subunit
MATYTPVKSGSEIGRRGFLAGSAGLTFGLAFGSGMSVTLVGAEAAAGDFEPNAWIAIGTDDSVTIVSPAAEMGQGVFTSMPMIVAEELDADWTKVKVVQAPHNPKNFGNPLFGGAMVTGASRTSRGYWPGLRMAGAQARQVIIENAASHWQVPASELTTKPNMVVHAKTSRTISYGEVAKFAKVPAALPKLTEADLKKPSEWRIIGTDVQRPDIPGKTNGTVKFGIDTFVPNMLYASILRSPVQGNGPDKVDDSAAMKVKGVTKVIPLDYGVAVVGTDIWATKQGKEALKVTWKTGAKADSYDSQKALDEYMAAARDYQGQKGVVAFQTGDLDAAFKGAAKKFAAEYKSDHVYHCTMEPMNATAWVKGDEVEVWTPTQAPTLVAVVASKVAGTKPEKVTVHTTFLGGGFGRRIEQDTTVDAVVLSKITGRPVKVVWSREDDVTHDFYRPSTAQRLEAAVDDKGKVVGWRHRIVAESIYARANPAAYERAKGVDAPVIDGSQLNYTIPNQLHDYVRQERGFAVGFWRAVGPGYTTFAVETFVDELAANAGMSPIDYRLQMLSDERAKNVIREVAKMARWGEKREGRALGIAYAGYPTFWETHIAEVVEISLNRDTGEIRVHKVWAALDPGVAIHPQNILAQVEGNIVMGTSQTLKETITVKGGAVQESNFHDYPVLRMDEAPEVETKILTSGSEKIGGMGEVALPPVAPAVANAIAAMTGKRLRHLPFLPEAVKATLKA